MYCPLCAQLLQPVERQGVEIDHCPSCGGLWLDRGELDQLIQREAVRALLAGQQEILRSRRNREYDQEATIDPQSTRVLSLR
jgi:Zn-finger nucleic acid-binding protein